MLREKQWDKMQRIKIHIAKIGQRVGWNCKRTMAPQRTKELNKVKRNKQRKATKTQRMGRSHFSRAKNLKLG